MDVTSKFKYGKVIIHLAVTLLLSSGLALVLLSFHRHPSGLKEIGGVVFGWICVLYGVYCLYDLALELTRVRIDVKGGRIKSLFQVRAFSWAEVKSIKYNVRNNVAYTISPFKLYHLEVLLEDGRRIPIHYENLANGHLIQQYVRYYFKKRKSLQLKDELPVPAAEIADESFMTFRGAPLLSLRGFILALLLLFMIVIVALGIAKSGFGLLLFIGVLLVFLANLLFCFYIQVSDDYLVLKNYFLPFITKTYRIAEIGDLSIESRLKLPNCLRIVGKSFRYRVIPCATLRHKDWHTFVQVMKERKRRVRADIF